MFHLSTVERKRLTANGKLQTANRQPLVPVLPVVRAAIALLSVLPGLSFAARAQVFVNDIPTVVFLGVVVTGGQQKSQRYDEEESRSEHRGTHGRVAGSYTRSMSSRKGLTVRSSRTANGERRTLKEHPETFQIITSWEILRHWHRT